MCQGASSFVTLFMNPSGNQCGLGQISTNSEMTMITHRAVKTCWATRMYYDTSSLKHSVRCPPKPQE